MSEERDEFADQIRAQTLAAFGLEEYDIGMAPVPLHVRIWRAVTFAYRRGRAIDWRSYNAAEAAFRAEQDAYVAALPVRMQEIAGQLSEALPDGLRFEWTGDDERQP